MIDDFVDLSEMTRGGVYILRLRGTVVYVGQSKCMLQRIYYHRSKDRQTPSWVPVKKGIVFDEVLVRVIAEPTERDRVERELIAFFQPRQNIAHKTPAPKGQASIRIGSHEFNFTTKIERRI